MIKSKADVLIED